MLVIPYVILIAIPALMTFVTIGQSSSKRRVLFIRQNTTPYMQAHNLALPCFFVLLLAMLIFRHETVGRDLANYKVLFEVFPRQDLQYFDVFRLESLYRVFNWFVGQFTDSYQVFLAIVAVITVLPLAYVYCKERRHSVMQIALFVSMSNFVMLFSGLRQAIAVSLGMVAYELTKQKKWVWFIAVVVVALGFHHSAFMIAFMYPLYHLPIKKKHLLVVAPAVVIILLCNRLIFGFLVRVLSDFTEEYDLAVETTAGYTMLILFAVFVIFSFVVVDEKKMTAETFGLRNFLVFALLLQCFAPVNSLAMRMNYYFIIFIPIAMAKFMDIPRKGMERVAKWACALITLYFTFDFLYKTYRSAVTGISPLDTIPYIPFWK